MTLRHISIFVLMVLISRGTAFAAPAKTVCPKFIAEKIGDIYYPRENYRCFSSIREAERAGFSAARSLVSPNFSGWWRWNLRLKSNSCGGPASSSSATTYFLQLKHDSSSGLFGSLCPGTETLIGAAPIKDTERGFSISSATSISSSSFCPDGEASISYIFEAYNFDALFTEARNAKLTQVTVCKNFSTKRCKAEWSGAGGREGADHRFWPQISNDLSDLVPNCSLALSRCQGCHTSPN